MATHANVYYPPCFQRTRLADRSLATRFSTSFQVPPWATRLVPPSGGGDRIRTDDPLVANQVLYQLSYAPMLGLEAQGMRPG